MDSIKPKKTEEGPGKKPDSMIGKVKWYLGLVYSSFTDETYRRVLGEVTTRIGKRFGGVLGPSGFIRDIFKDFITPKGKGKLYQIAVAGSSSIDADVNAKASVARLAAYKKFSKNFKVTDEIETTIKKVVTDTDMSILFDKYSKEEIEKIMSDPEALNTLIEKNRKLLKKYNPKMYEWRNNSAYGLGLFMTTGRGIVSNAYNIARGVGILENPTKVSGKTVKVIDELSTLYALSNIPVEQRTVIAELVRTEWKGMQDIAKQLEGFKKESAEKIFNGADDINIVKGYSKPIYDSSIKIEVGYNDAKTRTIMKRKGFTKTRNLGDKELILYVGGVGSKIDAVSGAIRLSDRKAMGTNASHIVASKFKKLDLSSKEIAIKVEEEIEKFRSYYKKKAEKMSKGSYKFSDKKPNLQPIFDENGRIKDFRLMMDKQAKEEILREDTRYSYSIGSSYGGIVGKIRTEKQNREMMKLIKEDNENYDYNYYRFIGPLAQDERILSIYDSLSDEDKNYIGIEGKLMGSEVNDERMTEIYQKLSDEDKEYFKKKDIGEAILVGPNTDSAETREMYNKLPSMFRDYAKEMYRRKLDILRNKRLFDSLSGIAQRELKESIARGPTIAVNGSSYNTIFGFSHMSLANAPGINKLPTAITGLVRFAEKIWSEMIKVVKASILVKIPEVLLNNMLSNLLFTSIGKGHNPLKVLKFTIESYKDISQYRKQRIKLAELEIEIGKKGSNKKVLNAKIDRIKRSMEKSPIDELYKKNLSQNVEDAELVEEKDTNIVTTFIEKHREVTPQIVNTGLDWVFLTRRTPAFKVMSEMLEVSDLAARDAQNRLEKEKEMLQADGKKRLPMEWVTMKLKTKDKYEPMQKLVGEEREEFLKWSKIKREWDIVEDFIQYAVPSSRFEEYLNRVGILMFTKYLKRIQRIIFKTSREKPVSAAAMLALSNLAGLPTIGESSFLVKDFDTNAGDLFAIYSPLELLETFLTPGGIALVT